MILLKNYIFKTQKKEHIAMSLFYSIYSVGVYQDAAASDSSLSLSLSLSFFDLDFLVFLSE